MGLRIEHPKVTIPGFTHSRSSKSTDNSEKPLIDREVSALKAAKGIEWVYSGQSLGGGKEGQRGKASLKSWHLSWGLKDEQEVSRQMGAILRPQNKWLRRSSYRITRESWSWGMLSPTVHTRISENPQEKSTSESRSVELLVNAASHTLRRISLFLESTENTVGKMRWDYSVVFGLWMPSLREYSCIICVRFSWETDSPKDCEILVRIAFQGIKRHPVYKGVDPSRPTPYICCSSDPAPAAVLRTRGPTSIYTGW